MFATPLDMIDRFDETILRDLCSDNGTAETDLCASSKMSSAIASAEGRVVGACQVGQLYQQADLAALTGPAQAMLVDLVCGLAMQNLLRRRPGREAFKDYMEATQHYEANLDQLRNGQRLFPIAANLAASTVDIEGPTTVQVTDLNLITTRARGYFPNPGSRLPLRQQ